MDTSRRFGQYLRTCLLALLIGPFAGTWAATIHEEDAFVRTYRWDFEGCEYSFRHEIPWELYHFYQEKPRVFHNYAVYTHENRYYQFLPQFVQELQCLAAASGLDRQATLRWVISFVQQLNYRNDQGEYPKFPIETLAERGGDCEDTSILLAAILAEMGYPTILINPPGHMAIAVACDDCGGAVYHHEGRDYYYVETTATGFGVGDIPESYRQSTDKIMPMTVRATDLWVLYAFIPKQVASRDMLYYVSEDAGLLMSQSQRGERLLTKATVRHIRVDGKVSTSRTYAFGDRFFPGLEKVGDVQFLPDGLPASTDGIVPFSIKRPRQSQTGPAGGVSFAP
jgi:hypothetical protein